MQAVVERLAVGVVLVYRRALVEAARDGKLHEARRVDEAEHTVRDDGGVEDELPVRDIARDDQVADALAGEGEGFRPGVADNHVLHAVRHPGHLDPVVGELAVGLVGDDVDGGAVLAALLDEGVGELPEQLRRIDDAGGVVGVIEDDGLGLRRDGPRYGPDVGHEAVRLARGHDDDPAAGRRDVVVVLEEVGADADDLVAGVQERRHGDAEPAGRADGHDDVVLGVAGAEARVERVRDGAAHLGIAGVGRVAVDVHGVLVRDDVYDGFLNRLGRREVGIADGVIEDVLPAELLGEALALLEHGPDSAAAGGHFNHSLGYHDLPS